MGIIFILKQQKETLYEKEYVFTQYDHFIRMFCYL